MTNHKLIKVCCVCQDYQIGNGAWYSPSAEERRKDYFEKTNLSHGYCQKCAEIVEKEIESKYGFLEKKVKEAGK